MSVMRQRVPLVNSPDWYRKVAIAVNLLLGDIPEGGTADQVLAKVDGDDWNLKWLTVAAASHAHTIANVTGLQAALDAKAPLASPVLTGVPRLPSYTVAGLPAVGTAGGVIYVSNESGGPTIAFSDGTNWRRATDLAIVS